MAAQRPSRSTTLLNLTLSVQPHTFGQLLCSATSPYEGRGTLGSVGGTELLQCHWHLPDDRELQGVVVHLCDMTTPTLSCLQHCCVDDLDGARVCAVAASHLGVQLADSTIDGDITELFVHVVSVCAAFVPEPNAIVFSLGGCAIEELVHSKQLSTTLLGLVYLLHEVPEPGL